MRLGFLILASICLIAQSTWAQQESLFSQYMYNGVMINPAYTGAKNGFTLTALSRFQWVGFAGAPRTFAVSGHSPLSREDKKHGIGGFALVDQIGITSMAAFGGSYAYRMPLGKEGNRLALGLQASALQFTLRGSDATYEQPGDPVFQADQTVLKPNFGAGAMYYSGKWYAGFSVQNLIGQRYNFVASSDASLARHFYFMGGYDIYPKKEDVNLIISPSALIRKAVGSNWSFDINTTVSFVRKFWAGVSYRSQDAIAFLVGVYPTKQFRIGYSYDLGMSSLRNQHSGSHEIMISYDFFKSEFDEIYIPRTF
jgi:type IX secretion system PorP/SprF family membrane protein